MTSSLSCTSQAVDFIDSRSVDWPNVRRTRTQFYQRFHYAYPGPIQQLKQRLMVIPSDRYGAQRLCSHVLSFDPHPHVTRQRLERFGNRIFELEVPEAGESVSFEVLLVVEHEADARHDLSVSSGAAEPLRQPTHLTRANREIEALARQLQSEAADLHDLAQRISDWVYGFMRYQSAVTTVFTTAAETLTIGRGLCQDYSHLMLAICRAAGLAARYVSGHLLGEGGSHAWVEVLLPTDDGFSVVAFDPTNNCRPDLSYVTVAVGRDYRDVSPTSGSFVAPYGGQLTSSKRAGLTLVEYHTGDIVESQPLQ